MAQRDYVELCAKSCFSFLKGASHPDELIQTAHDLRYRGLAITDLNGFYGMVRAHDYASRHGLFINMIYGVEIEVENASLSLIARDFEGYKRICRLLSESYQSASKGAPSLSRSGLEKWIHPQSMHSLLLPRGFPSLNMLKWLLSLTPLTQLVSRYGHPDLDRPLAKWLQELPSEIPRAWTWDARFHDPKRFEVYEIMDAILTNTPLSQKPPRPNAEMFLKPLSVLDRWQVPLEWTKKTMILGDSCSFTPKQIKYQYPHEWLPPGKTPTEFLVELCKKGLQIRYGGRPSPEVLKQLDHELALVKQLRFEDYFLTVWDIVQFARSKDILCQGRGSAANSLICYLLEVTSIDPVQMNLLFERFLSVERNEAPDIDIDFEHERREEVIQYIYTKYGRERAGMVATLITYHMKGALRDVGKALEIPTNVMDAVSKRLTWRETADEVFESLDWAKENPVLAQRWKKLSKQLKGFPRHIGQHTGGMILTHTRLDEMSPIEPATMPNRSVIQWDKYDIEKLGLLKIDILSLGMLTCLRKTFDLIRQTYGIHLELHTIPNDDTKTYEMLSRAETVGVFQVESRAQMSMLPRLRPRNFYDIVVEVAIVRPGPIQGGMVHPYLRRRMGLEKVTYAHPSLRPILEKTMGVPIFQEQVMKMAIEVAGYTPGEADELRRAMGAWKKTGNLEKYAADMSKRMIARGVPQDFCHQVCRQILGFGEYGFPESHAASFALLTYASAYLKAHYPAAFLCGLLNSMPLGFYSLHVLTSSFMREGVEILPLHTEFSNWDHQLEVIEPRRVAIRLGFRIVKNIQKDHVELFLKKRSEGEIDLFVFNQEERGSIALAADSIEKRISYWQALEPNSKNPLSLSQTSQNVLFPDLSPLASMFLDFEMTGTTLKEHPAVLLKRDRWKYAFSKDRLTSSDQLLHCQSQLVHVFGIVQIVQSPPTAKGMFFITMEDESGFLNLVLPPPIYKRYRNLLKSEWGLLVSGKLQNQRGSISILVKHIHEPRGFQTSIGKITRRDDLRKKGGWLSELRTPSSEELSLQPERLKSSQHKD